MSTGYWETGSLTYIPSPGVEVGRKSWKSWSGSNSIVTRRDPIAKRYRYVYRNDNPVNRKGKLTKHRVLIADPGKTRAARKAAQKLSPNPYTMTHYRKENELVTYKNVGESGSRTAGALERFGSRYATFVWDANHQLTLLSRLREKALGSDFNPAVFLAELPQSLHLIGETATQLAKGISYLKRRRWQAAWDAFTQGTSRHGFALPPVQTHKEWRGRSYDVIADRWISMQYGWRPLVSDLDALAKQVASALYRPLVHTVKASYAPKGELDVTDVTYGQFGEFHTHCESIRWESRRITAYFSEPPSLWQTTLSLPSIASAVWEKIPWSFVVDWALPIGTYLEARGATALVKAPMVLSSLNESHVGPIQGSMTGRFDAVIFKRTLVTDSDTPLPTIKPLSKIASWQHAANGLALLQQQRRKLR